MNNIGYQADFLGTDKLVELPQISPEWQEIVVRSDRLRNREILDYPNYSVVMNQETRQAFFSAANVNFKNNVGRGRSFRVDTRIDISLQLDNIYYKDLNNTENPFDRGHLTRRAAVAWGPTRKLANDASKDSCFFTNISLQHKNFNQDEWHALERAIENTNKDADDKFNIFTGPIFSPVDRFISPTRNLEPARVPSGFWKIISYIGRDSKEIETNAFIVFQDETAIRAMKQVLNNPQINPFEVFQTSTTHIENLTGIIFPEILFNRNPLFFFDSDITQENGISTPQSNRVTPLEDDSKIIFSQ